MSTVTTTTTTTTPAVNADELNPWATPCNRRRQQRFINSSVYRRMRQFIARVRELDELADELIEKMPESEALNDYTADLGQQFAEDMKAGMWSLRIVADLMSSEMPYRPERARRRPAKSKAKKRKPATPAATFIPLVGVLDARTQAERDADELAGKTWEDVAGEVIAGTAEPLTTPKHTNRIKNIA